MRKTKSIRKAAVHKHLGGRASKKVLSLSLAIMLTLSLFVTAQAVTEASEADTVGYRTGLSELNDIYFLNVLYCSPDAQSPATGSYADPMKLEDALSAAATIDGVTIILKDGVYSFDTQLTIEYTNNGTAQQYKTLRASKGATVTLDFSTQSYNSGDTSSNPRGLQLSGSYWYVEGIRFYGAADNGVMISGNNNVLENCIFEANRNSGLQIGRRDPSLTNADWPKDNFILNCTSFDNNDPATGANADGFAARLTCGNNTFDGCISYNNVGDGWDLYAESETGPIGVITMKNCIAFRNGYTSAGIFSQFSDGCGFKLGGSGVGTEHIVENCLSFENKSHGFTDNNNPENIRLTNSTSYMNGIGDSNGANFKMDRITEGGTFTNLLNAGVYTTLLNAGVYTTSSDKFVGTITNSVYYNSQKWYKIGAATAINNGTPGTEIDAPVASMFVSTSSLAIDINFHAAWRNSDGTVNTNGFLVLKKDAVLAGMGFLFGTQGVNYSVNVAINTTVAIAGVTPPAVGAAPVTAITETAQYTGTVTWSGAPTTFGYSTVYTATITLTPKTNYTFAGVAENFFTVAGATATNDANSGVITAVFPRTDGVPYIPPTPTIPGSGGVNIEYTKSGDAVTLQLPMSKVNALIESAEDGVVSLDLSGLKGTSIVNIPTDALSKIADAGLGLDVKLPGGNLAIDADALASFVDSAGGAQISLTLRQIEPSELSAAQGATLKSGDTVFEISVSSGGAEIHEFNGVFTATVNYNGKSPAAAWYLDGEGKREKLGGKYNVEDKTFTFTLPHLSLYVVGYDEVAAWENPFSDVSMDDWFYEDVYFAATHDPVLFNGTSATTFSPNTAMSRAMLVTVLWRLAGSPPVKTSEVIEFSDVPYGAYYEIAVDWARVNGIVSGIGGLFYPDANITRQDAATILCRFAEHLGLDVSASADLSAFADAGDVSGYAETAMEWAVSVGMIRGRSATQLAPKGSLTRAEIAAILHRFVENVVDAE